MNSSPSTSLHRYHEGFSYVEQVHLTTSHTREPTPVSLLIILSLLIHLADLLFLVPTFEHEEGMSNSNSLIQSNPGAIPQQDKYL